MTASHGDLDLQSVEQQQGDQPSSPVTLEDLFLHIIHEDWEILNTDQKQLYYENMMGIYREVLSLEPGASASVPGSQEGQPPEPRRDFWLDSVATQVGIMSHHPVPAQVPRENDTGVPSMQGVSGREPQERPLQANVCTQEAHLSILFETLMQHLLPKAFHRYRQGHLVSVTKNQFIHHHNFHSTSECEECGKIFQFKHALTQHRKFHIGEKQFMCQCCGKSFYRKATLATHKQCHPPKNSYRCEECGKLIKSSSFFVIHKRMHSGERPFQCAVCGNTFISKYKLTSHEKVHGGPTFGMVQRSPVIMPSSSNNLDVPCVVEAPAIVLNPDEETTPLEAFWVEGTLE